MNQAVALLAKLGEPTLDVAAKAEATALLQRTGTACRHAWRLPGTSRSC